MKLNSSYQNGLKTSQDLCAASEPGHFAGNFKFCIVIPTFNHERTIVDVARNVRAALDSANEHAEILIVNDGSRDATARYLASAGMQNLTLLTHKKNRGKGAALLTGFAHAKSSGYTHVISVDADGQHCPADILSILAAARQLPEALIIGERDMDSAGKCVPLRSKKGCEASRFWLRVITGRTIPDTQCGLRAYPLASTTAVPHRFKRYDFETEILARLAWGGVPIHNVPVKCIYFEKADRVSHFRPIRDTLRGIRVNCFLVARRLLPLPFRRLVSTDAPEGTVRFGTWWKISAWRDAIREAFRAGSSNAELAMAFSLGIFVGLTPFYLVQTILAIYFARRLHLNVLAAVIGSQISIPPLAPIWVALSYAVGHLLLKGEWVLSDLKAASEHWSWTAASLGTKIWPFLLGNFFVAVVVAILGLVFARGILYCLRGERLDVTKAEAI